MTDLLTYYFLPSVREGLATQIEETATGQRSQVEVSLTAVAYGISGAREICSVKPEAAQIALYGPGDVIGFDPRIVVHTDPKPNVGDFEANYFPSVEFADADFPWRYSVEKVDIKPWIVLVVLVAETRGDIKAEFAELPVEERDPKLPGAVKVLSTDSLPDLECSWRWAHVRVTSSKEGEMDTEAIKKAIAAGDVAAVSVLQCARRLAPGVRYSAFVVPSRALGRLAALGVPQESPPGATTLAWNNGNIEDFQLPYYYRWDFGTSAVGDFENLVRLLEPRDMPSDLGLRKMDCSNPGFGISGVNRTDSRSEEDEKGVLEMEGALFALDTEVTQWGKDAKTAEEPTLQTELADLLNRPNTEDLADCDDLANKSLENRELEFTAEDPRTQKEKGFSSIRGFYDVLKHEVEIRWEPLQSAVVLFECRQVSDNRLIFSEKLKSNQPTCTVMLDRLKPEAEYVFSIGPIGSRDGMKTTGSFTIRLPRVVPPAYGRWHHGQLKKYGKIVDAKASTSSWLDVLNLDPRHRAAAGLGAEVVRKNQEALMASAWEQLGAVKRANEILRKAQLGRDASVQLHKRLVSQQNDDVFFAMTAPMMRFLALPTTSRDVGGGEHPARLSVAELLRTQTNLPLAALDPAFRRMASATRVLAKRSSRMLARRGILNPRNTSGQLIHRLARGDLAAAGPTRRPAGLNRIADVSKLLSDATWPGAHVVTPVFDEATVMAKLGDALKHMPFKGLHNLPVADQTGKAVLGALASWLKPPNVAPADRSVVAVNAEKVIADIREQLPLRIHPNTTVAARVFERFQKAPAERRDNLDPILWAPEFETPMYEPLFELGHSTFLPGVEKIRQNTVACVFPNRRFIEAYLCGLNHEFAGELLWRGYPTDQRGTYFRTFWDRSESNDAEVKDIAPINEWGKPFGRNTPAGDDANTGLVLLIRGNLLARYPDTLIYAIDLNDKVPDVDWEKVAPVRRPLFFATLPPDISFFGFSFDVATARGDGGGKGMLFVIEQSPGLPRHGLDDNSTGRGARDANSAWSDFSLQSQFGAYLDSVIMKEAGKYGDWATASSASIATKTFQRPVRVAIHAKQLVSSRNNKAATDH